MRAHYRPTNGRIDYIFEFEKIDGSYRIFIAHQPPYPAGRAQDAVTTHRLGLGTARPYICWTDRIPTLDQAKTIAASWAENTERYIATGAFPLKLFTDWNDAPEIAEASRRIEPDEASSRRTSPTAAPPSPSTPAAPSAGNPTTPNRLPLRVRLRERIIR